MAEDILKMDLEDEAKRDDFLSAMDELLKTRGWKYMKGYFAGQMDMLLGAMASCSNPNELLRYGGQLTEVKAMLVWPDGMAKLALQKREHARKMKEAEAKTPKHPSAPRRP